MSYVLWLPSGVLYIVMSYKGTFKPRNPSKYRGNPTNIIYRSLWEMRLMTYLDTHPDVLEWASEEFSIPYRSPLDGRIHRYFPDFWIKQRTSTGNIDIKVIEVKPAAQTRPPEVKTKKTKRYVTEVMTWGVNEAKWHAAIAFCKDKGWKFVIMTEKELGIK
jgi:hypothetical protein